MTENSDVNTHYLLSIDIIADHSGREPVIVSPPVASLLQTLSKAGPDFIIGENCREAESEPDKSQRKMCLKLNLQSESDQVEQRREEQTSARRSSVLANSGGRTPSSSSSLARDLVQHCLTDSPSLARSPAMHEGFHLKDWRVERTPISTPGCADCPDYVPPKLSDDDEEVEETDSVNSETSEPISKGSGTSSFLPSSVDVSECRPELPANPPAETSAVETTTANLVKPPAGFTDSPVRNVPPDFNIAQTEEQLCPEAQTEVLVLEQEEQEEQEEQPDKQPENIISEEKTTTNTSDTCQDVLTSQKYKSYNQENFGPRDVSYHHPELVVCQRQGNFNKENLKNISSHNQSLSKNQS